MRRVQPNPHTDWVLALRGVRIRVRRVLPSLFLAPATIKKMKHSNQPKPITHPIQSHPSIQREKQGKKLPSRERKLLCACFVAVLVTWRAGHLDEFCFRWKRIERRRIEYARDSYRDEFIDFPPHSYSRVLPRFYSHALSRTFSHALPHTSSCALPQFTHGTDHLSYCFGLRENRSVSRCFGYGPCPHRGDRFSCRPGFPTGESFPHIEPRHLDSPRFPRRGSHPTRPSGEVQRTMKTSSGRMVKCWIPKIYLTNPSTLTPGF
jgi:hypothetical protein